jgi:2-polyprenyl-3-methyl-5-hydroxy-6-metoxy-1,4-benzoquinol methylase
MKERKSLLDDVDRFKHSSDVITNKVIEKFEKSFSTNEVGSMLDIGAGNGILIALIEQKYSNFSFQAVDYVDDLLEIVDTPLDVVNLNQRNLPYDDQSFDFVSMAEVIEHLENPRGAIREIGRVLKPKGHVVITTPNVLNLKSRLMFLFTGFHNLFGPLTVNPTNKHSTHGHITPIGYFYLSHALAESGFSDIQFDIDKKQSWAYLPSIVLAPLIAVLGYFSFRRQRKKKFMNETNEEICRPINSLMMLFGRTVVVTATKI